MKEINQNELLNEMYKKFTKFWIILNTWSLAKSKWNSVDVLISKALIDSNSSHDKFVLIINVAKEFDGMKEKIKNSFDK